MVKMAAENKNTIETSKIICEEIALINSIAERLAADSGVRFTQTATKGSRKQSVSPNRPANESK